VEFLNYSSEVQFWVGRVSDAFVSSQTQERQDELNEAFKRVIVLNDEDDIRVKVPTQLVHLPLTNSANRPASSEPHEPVVTVLGEGLYNDPIIVTYTRITLFLHHVSLINFLFEFLVHLLLFICSSFPVLTYTLLFLFYAHITSLCTP